MRCASSLYSPEPAAGASPLAPSVTPSSVTSSGKRTRKPSSKPASGTVIWTPPPSSETSEPSSGTAGLDAIAAEWISSLPVSPALPSASPGSGTVEPTSGTCGPRPATCFARFVPDSPISKTSPDSYPWVTDQARLDGTSEPYLQTWPNSGWMRSGRCSELTTLGLRTGGSGYGSSPIYPTPSATEYGSSQNGINSTRPSAGTPSLETMARRGSWPTPSTAMNAGFTRDDEKRAAVSSGGHRRGHCGNELLRRVEARAWPTPRAEDSESTGAHRGSPDTLTSAVRWSTPTTRDAESPAKITRGAGSLDRGNELVRPLGLQVLWPTPCSTDANGAGSRNVEGSLAHAGVSLTDAVRGDGGRGRWPTPAASDEKGSVQPGQRRGQLSETVAGLKLSPDWVEWLMNWPVGWSSLEPLADATALPWDVDPGDTGEVPRTTTGCPDRRARLRAIGNGQVPACAAAAFRLLTEARPC